MSWCSTTGNKELDAKFGSKWFKLIKVGVRITRKFTLISEKKFRFSSLYCHQKTIPVMDKGENNNSHIIGPQVCCIMN